MHIANRRQRIEKVLYNLMKLCKMIKVREGEMYAIFSCDAGGECVR